VSEYSHPLMMENFTKDDIDAVQNLLASTDVLTQSTQVLEFERKWSEWLGVKYSVFVNSGASANYLTIRLLKILHGNQWEIIVPSFTWISDIISIIDHGFKPVFVDIDLKNLSASEVQIKEKVSNQTLALFLTHAQGFNGLSNDLLNFLQEKKIHLIEDVCESHGARFGNQKLGSIGLVSNFSFYYAHHMTTIEGGMICTNDEELYDILRSLRSHGMVREMKNEDRKAKLVKKYPHLSPQFIFMYPGLNMRNNEISATLGLSQLKRLDDNVARRSSNFDVFLKNIDPAQFYVDYDVVGNSNYAFPVILKEANFDTRNKLEELMQRNHIEYRRGNVGGGNQLLQPYLENFYRDQYDVVRFKNVDHVHHFGYYVGNYPSLSQSKIENLCELLNGLKYEK